MDATKVRKQGKIWHKRILRYVRFWHEIINESLIASFSRLVCMYVRSYDQGIKLYQLSISCQNLYCSLVPKIFFCFLTFYSTERSIPTQFLICYVY